MAVTAGTIEAVFRLRDQFSAGMAKAVKNAQSASQQIGAASKQVRNTGAKLTAGITLPMLGAATAALKFSTDLNESMANVATLIPGNVSRVEELKVAVQDMAIATGKSTTDISEGLYQVVSAFGDGADTASILKTNVEAAAAGMATTSDAIALTSAVTKAYGTTTAEGVRQAADLAFTTVKLGQTSFPELADAIGKVAVSSSGLNITQQELNAVFATMTGVTGGAAVVSTQFRGALVGLKKPSEEMVGALNSIGFETGEAAIASLGFQGTLTALAGTTGGNVGEMAKLFESTESWDFIAGIAGVQAEKFTSNLDAMEGSTGTLSEALNEQQNGINAAGFAWERLKQQFVVTAQQIGDKLAPSFQDLLAVVNEKVVPAVKKLVDWFVQLTPAEQKAKLMVAALVALTPVLILMVGQLGLAVTAMAGFASKIGLTTAATWLYNTAVKALKLTHGGMKAILVKFVGMLGLTTVAEGGATVATGLLSAAFLSLWAATGVGLVIIAAIAAAMAIWKFRDKIAEVLGLKNAFIRLKGMLGFLTEEEVKAAIAANALGDEIEDMTPSADELRKALSENGLTGTVEDLQTAMANLSGVAGALSEDEMRSIAERAIELRNANQQLTPELQRIVEWFEKQQEAAGKAAQKLAEETAAAEQVRLESLRVAEALAAQEEAQQELIEKTEELRSELSGDGLAGELAMLQSAWDDLTPAQQENQYVMERVAARAEALASKGAVLDDGLRQVVESVKATSDESENMATKLSEAEKSAEDLNKRMLETANRAQKLSDVFSGKNLRKEVNALEMALGNLIFMEEDSAEALLRVGEAAENLREGGARLSPRMAQLADDFVAVQSAANDFVGPPEQAIKSTTEAIDLGKELADVWEGIPDLIVGALKGGGDAFKALGAQFGGVFGNFFGDKVEGFISSKLGDKLGGAIGGLFGPLGSMAGSLLGKGIGKAVGKIGGWFKGLFGGGVIKDIQETAENMWDISLTKTAARASEEATKITGDAFTGMLLSLGAIIEESGGVMAIGFGKVSAAARDMFSAIDIGKLDADQALSGLLPVLEQMAVEFENADAAGQAAFLELITLAQQFGLDMDAIVQVVGQDLVDQALGTDLPGVLAGIKEGLGEVTADGLSPMLDQLLNLGVITEAQKQNFSEMAGQAVFDTQAAEAAAGRWGIALSDLGPKFQNAKLGERAQQVADDFAILAASGMPVEDIILAQGDAIHALVRDSRWAGAEIPDSMRPVIEAMIEQGSLTDENGQKITDMAQLDFAKPMEEKLAEVMASLGALIQKFIDALAPIGNVSTAVANIPDATVNVGFNVSPVPSIHIPDVRVGVGFDVGDMPQGMESFQHGTGGRFVDFGAGTPAMLHGMERITPISETGREGDGMANVERRLGRIETLLKDQPRAFGLAISDSLTLIN